MFILKSSIGDQIYYIDFHNTLHKYVNKRKMFFYFWLRQSYM
jgi:hypothetical protein